MIADDMENYLHLFWALLFGLFAYFQLNDPDPWAWVGLYLWVALMALLAFLGRPVRVLLWGGLSLTLGWALYLLPDFINWVGMGMPSITSQMKAEAPHIELTREFLGLLICGLAFVLYLRQAGRLHKG